MSSSSLFADLLSGMDAASLSVSDNDHTEGRMDVPMRSFFPEYYPNLVRLYRSIGVKFHDADNTLSCFDVDINLPSSGENKQTQSDPEVQVQEPYLSSRSYQAGMGQTITLPDLPPFSIFNPFPFGRRILGYCRIARDYFRLLIVSKEFMAKGQMMDVGKHPIEWGNGRSITLREFLEAGGYSHEFSAWFVPIFASVCNCSFERMMEYPACIVLEYVARCMPFGRMQFVSAGVREVTEKLSENIRTIHYNTMIEDILIEDEAGEDKNSDGPVVLVDSHGVQRTFDHVIFATQANQAAATLAGYKESHSLPKPFLIDREQGYNECDYGCMEEHDRTEPEMPIGLEIESLKPSHPFYQQVKTLLKFPYERARVVCHTDTSFLPKNPAHWRFLNIAKSSSADVLASPLNKITKELEPEMELRSRKARSPRSSAFSLRSSSALSKAKVPYRQRSRSRLRAHFAPAARTKSSHSTTAAYSHNSAMATHFMESSASKPGSTTRYLQTTNPLYQPRPEAIISSAWFERAVVNPASMKAVDELHMLMEQQTSRWIQGQKEGGGALPHISASDRVWFVGCYAYPGIPLLEACVASAVQAVDRIVAAESSYRLAPSVEATESSFLKQSNPAWGRRRERQTALLGLGGKPNHSRTTMTSMYFQTAWKDTLQDPLSSSAQVETWRSNIYVEMAWMMMLYLVAIGKWFLVIVVESLGGDGSSWARA
ncbi:hypothetical protein BGX34_002981 [Mortierella sp. NVP85]|nr:hypothetical protein BGX34_002981 [Mortierella sp. NVP85]